MSYTTQDLKNKGMVVIGGKAVRLSGVAQPEQPKKKGFKIATKSKGKDYIELALRVLKIDYVKEYKFSENRKFRFDYCVIESRLGIEWEGIFSAKSRHTTVTGYSKDTEKYNLAAAEGWRVLRYTAKTYKNVTKDLIEILDL